MKNKPNFQDEYLMNHKEKRTPVTIYLSNGMPMKGVITKFDHYTIILNDGRKDVLIYKHAVLTVV